jgi:hypothetical protein
MQSCSPQYHEKVSSMERELVEYMDTDLGLSAPERAIDRKHILLDLIDNDMGSFEKLWAFYRKLKCSKMWLPRLEVVQTLFYNRHCVLYHAEGESWSHNHPDLNEETAFFRQYVRRLKPNGARLLIREAGRRLHVPETPQEAHWSAWDGRDPWEDSNLEMDSWFSLFNSWSD